MKSIFKKILIVVFFLHLIVSSSVFGDNHNKTNINQIYTNLKSKNFSEAIVQLNSLSEENNSKAQHLYSQILYAGEITTQDFEKSYFWAIIAKLGGIKKINNLIDKLDNLIIEELKFKIHDEIKLFLEKHALKGNKLAVIQIAKWNLDFAIEPDYENAYKWYNVAVALGIKSAKVSRDDMLNEIDKQRLFEVQKESNAIFKKINNLGG